MKRNLTEKEAALVGTVLHVILARMKYDAVSEPSWQDDDNLTMVLSTEEMQTLCTLTRREMPAMGEKK